jgi:hypothetical protein
MDAAGVELPAERVSAPSLRAARPSFDLVRCGGGENNLLAVVFVYICGVNVL